MLPRHASGDHPRARDALQRSGNVKAMPYSGIASYGLVSDIVIMGASCLMYVPSSPFSIELLSKVATVPSGSFSATSPTPIFKPRPHTRSQGMIFRMGKPQDTSHH